MPVSGLAGVVASALGLGGGAIASAQPVVNRVVAVSGLAAPGTDAGTTFYLGGLSVPTVNAREDVAFGALLDVASKDWFAAGGIWIVPAGAAGPSLAYRSETYSGGLNTPFMDDQGRIAFWTSSDRPELRVGQPGRTGRFCGRAIRRRAGRRGRSAAVG